MDLLQAWANWKPDSPPFVLDGDLEVLNSDRSVKAVVTRRSWQEAIQTPDFCAPGDKRLHLDLLPHPFCGDVRRASIYVLLLNPGLGPSDYYGEYENPEYRAALLANLSQRPANGVTPFLFLDPHFAWHGGFEWWHGKLARVMESLASAWQVSFAEARARLGSVLASVELLPYHSSGFHDAGGWLQRLHSVALARAFVEEFILPRVQRGEAIVIVTRKVAAGGLVEQPGVVTYSSPAQARSAHLTPKSPGGRAILKHLGVSG
ncbi:MAG: hypothetical protein NTZ17_13920 [Phycisphaerae bacterium]|nr:hypothetical protein [Phycisphaerae bacterium]